MDLSNALMMYMASHAIALAAFVVWLVMLSRMSRTRRTPQSTLAWLLALAVVPLVAIPLYLALGTRKIPGRAKGQRLGATPVRAGHSFELLTTGEAAFSELMTRVQGAERSIDLTMFILGNDDTGRAMVAALVQRAQQGVRVRVILDAVGSMRTQRWARRQLEPAGARVRLFMPLRHSPVRGRSNLRSHRKIAIIDDEALFTGGMNLANEYMGPVLAESTHPNDAAQEPARWRDVAAIVRGPVTADALALFESDWDFCGGSRQAQPNPTSLAETAAVSSRDMDPSNAGELDGERVQFVPSGPDITSDTLYDIFLTQIFNARDRVAIVTPYYVPDDALQHALVLAARRGVKTELLIPAWSNHRIADMARRQFLRELTTAGVVVHYYTRGMVHAKAMVVDDTFAYVGSTNFDMRSLFLNYENALCVYSADAIAQIRAFVDDLIVECPEQPPTFPERRVLEQIALLVAPEL